MGVHSPNEVASPSLGGFSHDQSEPTSTTRLVINPSVNSTSGYKRPTGRGSASGGGGGTPGVTRVTAQVIPGLTSSGSWSSRDRVMSSMFTSSRQPTVPVTAAAAETGAYPAASGGGSKGTSVKDESFKADEGPDQQGGSSGRGAVKMVKGWLQLLLILLHWVVLVGLMVYEAYVSVAGFWGDGK